MVTNNLSCGVRLAEPVWCEVILKPLYDKCCYIKTFLFDTTFKSR